MIRSGMVYHITYRMHNQQRLLNMPIRDFILNTGALTERSHGIYKRVYVIYFF